MENNNTNSKPKHFRQGDVLITRIDKLPEGLKETPAIAAFGEVTGHSHTVHQGGKGLTSKDDVSLAEYLEIEADLATLDHQEHSSVSLEKGTYKVIRQFEYAPKELVRVAD